MKIGTKLSMIVVIFIAMSFIAIILILSTITENNYHEVEQAVHQRTMENVYEIFKGDFINLSTLVYDWAEWDVTLDYIRGENPEYIDENFSIETYEDLNFQYLAIFYETGALAYGKSFDMEAYRLLEMDDILVNFFASLEDEAGVIEYRGAYISFKSAYISDNSGVIKTKGKMVMAYELSDDYMARLNKRLGYETEVAVVDESYKNTNGYEAIPTTADDEFGIKIGLIHKGKAWQGQLELPIYNTGKPLTFTTLLDDLIYKLGLKQKRETTAMVIASLTLLLIIMSVAIRRIIVRRIEKLNIEVDAITLSGSAKKRVNIRGVDEIGQLSAGINMMLSELDGMHQEVFKWATYDELTGIYNRRYGYEQLEKTMNIHKKNGMPVSVAFVDINNMKKVNDSLGHSVGDKLILDVVTLMKKYVFDMDYIARLGGDEFLFVMPGKNAVEATIVMQMLRQEAEAINRTSDGIYSISFSYGIAMMHMDMNVDDLIDEADKQMYIDKKSIDQI